MSEMLSPGPEKPVLNLAPDLSEIVQHEIVVACLIGFSQILLALGVSQLPSFSKWYLLERQAIQTWFY